jgi:DME family drug/metabolite transporter
MLVTIALDRRAPARGLFVALGLAISGSAIVVAGGADLDVEPIGVVLVLYTAVSYTGYLMATDRKVKRSDPLTAAAWLGMGAVVAHVTFAFAFAATELPSAEALPELAGMAVFSAGAFAAMLGGLQLVGALRNSIIGVMEPLTVAVLALVFLDEPITVPLAVGGVLILVGAVVATLVRTTRTVEPTV